MAASQLILCENISSCHRDSSMVLLCDYLCSHLVSMVSRDTPPDNHPCTFIVTIGLLRNHGMTMVLHSFV